MKRASYRAGVRWIAENDEPLCMIEREIGFFVSSLMLADLFGVEPERVGRDVVRVRRALVRAARRQEKIDAENWQVEREYVAEQLKERD